MNQDAQQDAPVDEVPADEGMDDEGDAPVDEGNPDEAPAPDVEPMTPEEQPTKPDAAPAPEPPVPEVTQEQMLRIKRATDQQLKALLDTSPPESIAAAVKAELAGRAERFKPAPVSQSLRVTKGGLMRTHDGFFTEVKVGSLYPIANRSILEAAGIQVELVKSTVAEDAMGVPRSKLA